MKNECGGAVKLVKGLAEENGFKSRLLIAPNIEYARKLCILMQWPINLTAIITDPYQLETFTIYPGETIHVVMGVNPSFLSAIQTAACMLIPGEQFSLKLYAV